ncbi:unnamed protein product [Sphagnum tenellum]
MASAEEDNLFSFVTEGVLLTSISILGLVGNAMSVFVLLKTSMRGNFSKLLTSLASFDGLFLLSAIFTFGLPVLSARYKQQVYIYVIPITYGLSHTFRVGSVYSTLNVTLERFFAIVLPFRDFSSLKKWLLPSTAVFAVAYNVPKFFELTTQVDPVTNETFVTGSSLRKNPHYVSIYIFWSKFVLIELLPYLTIIVLNSFIVVKIVRSSRFRLRMMGNARREAVEMELLSSGGESVFKRSLSRSRVVSMSEEQVRYYMCLSYFAKEFIHIHIVSY